MDRSKFLTGDQGAREAAKARIYETIISATPDLVYVFTLDYKFVYANKALLGMWGKTWDTAVGKGLRENGYEEWHAAMHEREIDHVRATGESVRGEVGFPHAELGRRVYDYIFVPVFNAKGEVEAVAGTTRDISDIKQAELQLKEKEVALANAIELAELGTWRLEGKTGQIILSPRYAELHGRRELYIDLGSALSNVAEFDRDLVRQKFEEAMRPGSSGRYDAEYHINNELTGNTHIIHALGQASFDAAGNFVRIDGTAQDVTAQRELQLALEIEVNTRTEELQAMNEELASTNEELSESTTLLIQSNEELSQFAHVASHDLQEPVRKISVFVEMLEKSLGVIDERSKKYLDKIDESANRMLTLIRDVLTHSQLSNRESKFEKIDLNKVLSNTLNEFELLIQEKGCKIESSKLPVIDAVDVQMNQLFSNLISNAMKFSVPEKPMHLTINATRVSEEEKKANPHLSRNRDYYCISFTDNGIGFDQSHSAQIFEIFQRLHNKKEYSGTGIGLATCKKIVLNHNGQISAASSPGNGAKFEILLPATQG